MKAHLVNCTYCIYRWTVSGDKKRNIREVERCRLTNLLLPHPSQPGRWCDQFQQEGHSCQCCIS